MKRYKYIFLYLSINLGVVSCGQTNAADGFLAPRNDSDRLQVVQAIRTNSHDSSTNKQLHQAGLGADYYYAYHLEQEGDIKRAFDLLLSNVHSNHPWQEYSALKAFELAQSDSQKLKKLEQSLKNLTVQNQALPGISYLLAHFAYEAKDMQRTMSLLSSIPSEQSSALGIENNVAYLRIMVQSHLRQPYWQTALEQFTLQWPMPLNTKTLSDEITQHFSNEDLPTKDLLLAFIKVRDTRSAQEFNKLSALLSERSFSDFFNQHPQAVRIYMQLSGMANQRTLALDFLNKALNNEQLSERARFEIIRSIGVLEWRLGRYRRSSQMFASILDQATNEADYNDVLWYYLFSLYRINLNELLNVVNSNSFVIRTNPSWFDDFFQTILRDLTATYQFASLSTIYDKLIDTQASIVVRAQYGWVLSRAMHHGFLPADRPLMVAHLQNATLDPFSYSAFMAAAVLNDTPAALANAHRNATPVLNERVDNSAILSIDDNIAQQLFASNSAITQYINLDLHALGFIYYNLPKQAIANVRRRQIHLQADTIRLLARGLNAQGDYLEAIRMMNRVHNRPLFQPDRVDLEILYPLAYYDEIQKAAHTIDLNPSIYLGLIRTESGFSPAISSHASAVGLAQVMPGTARDMARLLKISEDEIDLTDVEQNLLISTSYIDWIQRRLDGMYAMLAGYNGGPNRVRRWREEWRKLPEELFIEAIPFDETRNYVKSIVVASATYEYLYHQESPGFIIGEIFPSFKRSSINATEPGTN